MRFFRGGAGTGDRVGVIGSPDQRITKHIPAHNKLKKQNINNYPTTRVYLNFLFFSQSTV